MFIWVSLKGYVRLARILWIITEICSNQGFLPGLQENYQKTISSWSCDMEGHAQKCLERYCEPANKTTEQLYKVATPCMDDHQFKEEDEWIMHSLLANCSEMSIFYTYWKTWCFEVCEQTCSCGNEMNKSMWQTFGAFDLLHSSHMWIQARFFCGKHSTTLHMRIVSSLRRRTWRLEVKIRRNSLHFRKSHVRTNKLDVQETDFSFTQFHGSWNYFSRCRFTHGWDSRSRSLVCSDWSISFLTKPNQHNQKCKRATVNLSATPQSQKRNRFQLRTPISIWPILITFHQAEHIMVPMLCCMSLRTMKPLLRW